MHCLAPAKINLFLHIIGKRSDGYHELQSVFQLIDWFDELVFEKTKSKLIVRGKTAVKLPYPEQDDLCLRAAHLLQQVSGCSLGVKIYIKKNIAIGAGLGGGSSDAATTLIALNQLWRLNLTTHALLKLAYQLGADVPFFVNGQNAFAEGIGEKLQAVLLPKRHFVIVKPDINLATHHIFNSKYLTLGTKPIKIADFANSKNFYNFGRNDLEKVVICEYPEIGNVIQTMKTCMPLELDNLPRMSGSGSCIFSSFADFEKANYFASCLPQHWNIKVVASLNT